MWSRHEFSILEKESDRFQLFKEKERSFQKWRKDNNHRLSEEYAILNKHSDTFQRYKQQENRYKNITGNKTELIINHIQEATANQINNTENYQF